MSLVTPMVNDGGQVRAAVSGDLFNSGEVVQSNSTAGSATLTAQQVIGGILNRTGPGGAYNDTTPAAAEIIAALMSNGNYQGGGAYAANGVQTGTTFRFRHINTVAFIATLVAGAGVSLAGVTANAASSFRDYLVTILNGTPPQNYACTTTNASAVVTGMTADQTKNITPGMAVSGTGIPGGATVLSVQPGVGFTLSANATATGSLVALAFTPRVEFRGIGSGLI